MRRPVFCARDPGYTYDIYSTHSIYVKTNTCDCDTGYIRCTAKTRKSSYRLVPNKISNKHTILNHVGLTCLYKIMNFQSFIGTFGIYLYILVYHKL